MGDDLPDWAKRLGAAAAAAITAGTAPAPAAIAAGASKGASTSAGAVMSSNSWTQYLPYAAAGLGLLLLLKSRR